eukprot:Pgem_evm1s11629
MFEKKKTTENQPLINQSNGINRTYSCDSLLNKNSKLVYDQYYDGNGKHKKDKIDAVHATSSIFAVNLPQRLDEIPLIKACNVFIIGCLISLAFNIFDLASDIYAHKKANLPDDGAYYRLCVQKGLSNIRYLVLLFRGIQCRRSMQIIHRVHIHDMELNVPIIKEDVVDVDVIELSDCDIDEEENLSSSYTVTEEERIQARLKAYEAVRLLINQV